MAKYVVLGTGDPAPWFHGVTPTNPRFAFDTAAGRHIVLCLLGRADDKAAQASWAAVIARHDLFDDAHACIFAVIADPADVAAGRLIERIPGRRVFIDTDLAIARAYGAASVDADGPFHRRWVVLTPDLRIRAVVAMRPDGSDTAEVLRLVAGLPPIATIDVHAPILVLPDVFEPALCDELIGLYRQQGGKISGFMREIDGKTMPINDTRHKVRRDYSITDDDLTRRLQGSFVRRVVPMIARAHQFHVTRMERYIVACYSAEDGGHFNAHRDNTTKGTAHRRFAVSVNLNDDFDGGEVGFPEYGPRRYKAPAGGAVVFSCSLLHSVSTVTRGERYAFLPFLYDDAAAAIRTENLRFLATAPGQAAPARL